MANITPRKDKDGNIISYQIRVFRGRDASGKRLKDYMMTWRPKPGMTKRQIEKELERQATLFEVDCKLGNVSTEKPTFEKYAEYVLDLKARTGTKPKTIAFYQDMLKHILPEIGPLKLQDIRADHLNRLYGKLAKPGANKKTGAALSAKSIMGAHRTISAILAQAVKESHISANVAERATPPKLPKHEVEALEIEEIQAIMECLEKEPLKWQVMTHLLISTGCRRGEALGLAWKCVDWTNNRLYLCENRVNVRGKGAISTTLKSGDSRWVSVSPSVMALLKRWRTEQASLFLKLGISASGYILTTNDGRPMHPDTPTSWLRKFAKRNNLPPLHPHLFRHAQASLLIAEGVDVLTVSKRLGHAQTSTTMNIYSHILAKSDEKASATLDNILYKQA